jgi:hypothetical protein
MTLLANLPARHNHVPVPFLAAVLQMEGISFLIDGFLAFMALPEKTNLDMTV